EMTDERGGKAGLQSQRCRQRRAQPPLAALDEIERRMLAGKALGRASERVAFEYGEGFAHGGLLEEFAKCFVVVEEPMANGGELIFLRHVGSGGDDDFLGADVEVIARAGGLLQALMRPPGGHVSFVGRSE